LQPHANSELLGLYVSFEMLLMREALQEVAARPTLSADVREVVERALAA